MNTEEREDLLITGLLDEFVLESTIEQAWELFAELLIRADERIHHWTPNYDY